eukprot:TRINITY_DN3224_c0_g1::TRINITY_DN3224_c0_g1_i1::g.29682::m.29682 TRINITY_DN3224_c0_g1::TRINITY_DN3224_c0_g1_i1::g.29682  ORF type:complete len:280 (+),score=28.41,TOM20_plant/PF06552.7/0.025,EF-hand_1/PF00036.27/2e+03,EF-hand_1/PF00036.27/0.094,EF-hand_6/PF13405.1/4.3e+03,EF-hand_6/PF13405.1/0.19,EF-hand_8/PF13833.1/5.1e+02,EF-hand_8/PF13833.1/0.64,EF-hand_5/PF13202.1/0.18,Takusan/PF04822.8/60,Takusan/PF04822.8/5.2,EF-hand_7/PF13499.1/7.5 TRINITY_DN3224_c0_g1_i1:40-879(+)
MSRLLSRLRGIPIEKREDLPLIHNFVQLIKPLAGFNLEEKILPSPHLSTTSSNLTKNDFREAARKNIQRIEESQENHTDDFAKYFLHSYSKHYLKHSASDNYTDMLFEKNATLDGDSAHRLLDVLINGSTNQRISTKWSLLASEDSKLEDKQVHAVTRPLLHAAKYSVGETYLNFRCLNDKQITQATDFFDNFGEDYPQKIQMIFTTADNEDKDGKITHSEFMDVQKTHYAQFTTFPELVADHFYHMRYTEVDGKQKRKESILAVSLFLSGLIGIDYNM